MVDEFKTKPEKVEVTGNIVNTVLTDLTDFSGFILKNAAVVSDGTAVINGKTVKVMKMIYTP